MRYIIFIVILIFSTFVSEVYSQWAPKKGEGGAIFSLRYFESDAFYNAEGDLVGSVNNATFNKYELGVYWSYGLGKRFGLFGGLSFAALRYNDVYIDNKSAGFGNPMLGVVYQMTDYPSPILGATLSTTPPLRFPADAQPELGGNFAEWDATFSIANGMNPFKSQGFFSFGLGLRYKANVYTEITPRIYTSNGIDIVKDKFATFFGAEYSQSTNTQFRSLKFGITLLYKINKTFGIGVFGEFLTLGRNVSAGPSGGLSFWYSLWK